jgi:hypothetical protein
VWPSTCSSRDQWCDEAFDADQAGLQLLKERQDVATLQLTADDHFAIVINAVDLKFRLGNVETEFA